MLTLTLKAPMPNGLNSPAGKLAIRLALQQMDRDIRDQAKSRILVQQSGPTPQLDGSSAVTTHAFLLDQQDVTLMHDISQAVARGDDSDVLDAARAFARHLNGDTEHDA